MSLCPPIGLLLNGVDFSKLKIVLQDGITEVADAAGAVTVAAKPEVAISYGVFINDAITLAIVGFCVFLMVKAVNNMKKKEEAAPATPPAPSKEETLLTEIRDLLAKN